jgi:hypothetical protein
MPNKKKGNIEKNYKKRIIHQKYINTTKINNKKNNLNILFHTHVILIFKFIYISQYHILLNLRSV